MPPNTTMMRRRRAANRSCRRRPPGLSDSTVTLRNTSRIRPKTKLLSSGCRANACPAKERGVGVGGRHPRASEVAKRKAVARRFSGRALLQLLMQVPVHPLVAVQESQHVAARPERDVFREPREPHRTSALAPRTVEHDLLERPERLRHLQHD